MESELSRLASFFSFPFNSPVSPTDLVKAGFYYEGNRDEVICYRCSLKHQGWKKGDIPYLIHSSKSLTCPLVVGNEPDEPLIGKGQNSFIHQFESLSITPSPGATGGPEDTQNQNGHNNLQRTTRNTVPGVTSNKTNDIKLPVADSDLLVQSRTPVAGTDDITTDLEIVVSNDKTIGIRNEITQDATCDVPEQTNDNLHEDRCASGLPGCQQEESLIVEPSTQSNAVQGHEREKSLLTEPSRLPEEVQDYDREESLTMEPLGVTDPRPKYPQFAVLATRLATYVKWPSHLNQRPEQLADSGLFYEGNHDYVRCFYCAGGLREWEPHDVPSIEHARWFPLCTFMRQLKGDRFIMDVQSGKITSELQSACTVSSVPRDDGMDNPAVISIMEMGYTKRMVSKAVSTLRKQKDIPLTAANLLQVVWDLEESGQSPDEKEDEEFHTENTIHQTTHNNSTMDTHKSEPVQDLEALENENRELREQKTCKVCLDEEAIIVFLPCGHLVTCPMCASALRKCPVCRTYIRGTVKAIIS